MTDFSYINLDVPVIDNAVPEFFMFQPIEFNFSSQQPLIPVSLDIPPDADGFTPALPVDPGTDNGAIVGTPGADKFVIDSLYDGGTVLLDFTSGQDKIMIDHNLVPGLPLGHVDPAQLYDGEVSLSWNGQTIAVMGEVGQVLTANDLVIF